MATIKETNKIVFYILLIALIIFGLVIFINLILTLIDPYLSLVAQMNNETNTTKDLWEMRGQMGDVLSGHFTALAFIGLLISLQYQRKSIEQMSTTIKQQNESFLKQSEALNLQIVEFKQQTEEFEHQTTEFKISNYLQIIERNYSRLNELEASFTYTIGQNKYNSYRDLLNNLDKSTRIAFRDLEMLVSQLKIIETNIQFVHLDKIKETLENEYNVYKDLYYKDKIESIIYSVFFKNQIKDILDKYLDINDVLGDINDVLGDRNIFGERINNTKDPEANLTIISEAISHKLEDIKIKGSGLEKQLALFFIDYLAKEDNTFLDFLKKYSSRTPVNKDFLNDNFKINTDLIWDTESFNISEKVK